MADYRDAPAKCPACQELMELRSLSEAMVDTCARCRGLWVDWFDGDVLAIVHEAAPLSFRPTVDIDPTKAHCPRCSRTLMPETFGGSVLLLRCAECAGCFVPREAFTALMELDLPAHSRHGADVEKQGAFARLLAAIRRFAGTAGEAATEPRRS
jgi:Zn-finger nucleic acid-binding protein